MSITLCAGDRNTVIDRDIWIKIALWNLSVKRDNKGYECVIFSNGPHKGKALARFILGILDSPEWIADHEDRDPFNNLKANLRKVNATESVRNRNSWGEIAYRGVSKNGTGYAATITVNYKKIHLGTFSTAELAFAARLKAETKYWSETK